MADSKSDREKKKKTNSFHRNQNSNESLRLNTSGMYIKYTTRFQQNDVNK